MQMSLSPGKWAASIGTPSSVTMVRAYGTGLVIGTFCVNAYGGLSPPRPWERMPPVPTTVRQVCQQARAAPAVTRELHATAKDPVLVPLAHAIHEARDKLKSPNPDDVAAARVAGGAATLGDRVTPAHSR